MTVGHLSLVLHAHLPFVRHPEYGRFLEEDWLFEAMTETYIPLLRMLTELAEKGVGFRLAIGLTPSLSEMLADGLLIGRYREHLERLTALARDEVGRTSRDEPEFAKTARMYLEEFEKTREYFEGAGGRILDRFRGLMQSGHVELLFSAATHGYLPLFITDTARRAQIQVGYENFIKHFGAEPAGAWLPECAYDYGIDDILAEFGVRYFIGETHAVLNAAPAPEMKTNAPIFCPSGVACFARDVESSKQIWSRAEGYPGNGLYREFYRDVGYDADYGRIERFLHGDGVRRNVGIKYHRITGPVALGEKEPYDYEAARAKAAEHASHFLSSRAAQAERVSSGIGRPALMAAPFDAELFGHWWFEGIEFLRRLIEGVHYGNNGIGLLSPGDYLERYPENQEALPSPSSWGDGGFNEVWINDSNDWIWPHLHAAEERMIVLARSFRSASGLLRRALNQASRELLLAQASDWPFIMSGGTHIAYAQKRLRTHIAAFNALCDEVEGGSVGEGALAALEKKDNCFSEVDYEYWHPEDEETRA